MRPINLLKSFALYSLLALSASCETSSAQYAADYDLRHDYQSYPPQYAQTPAPDPGRYRYENYDYEDYEQEAPPPPTAEDPQVDPETFREPLESYGRWENTPDYGSVWVPSNVDPAWRPYTVGHWSYTSYGWTWVSYEPFGWATYHYGRWACLPNGAWGWVPGRVWGPAWVSWRYGDGYCGWAPLPPAYGFATRVEVWDAPVIPQHYYSFVGAGSLCSPYVNRYILPHDRVTFYGRTHHATRITVVDHRVTNCGLDLGYVERHGGRVERGNIHSVRRPHDGDRYRGNDVAVYRPTHRGNDIDRKREIVKVPRYPDNDRPSRDSGSKMQRAAVDRPTREITPPARQPAPAKVDRHDDRDRTPVRVGPREFEYVSKDADRNDKPVVRAPSAVRKEVDRPARATSTDRPAPRIEPRPTPKVEAKPSPKVEARPSPKVEARPSPKVEARPSPKVEARPTPSRAATDRPTRSEPARSSADSSGRAERSSPRGDSFRSSKR